MKRRKAASLKKKKKIKPSPSMKKKQKKAVKSQKVSIPARGSKKTQSKATASRSADPAKWAVIQKKLVERRKEILSQVEHLEKDLLEEAQEQQNTPGDLADHGSGELSQHLSVALMENDRQELERIETALRRIQEGTYGQCIACGKPIPMVRLRAIPWASLCLSCQAQNESR